jgi:subtilisin family serine protease
MKSIRTTCAALLAASALVFGLATATARAQDSVPAAAAENAGRLWFVELGSPPTADGTSLAVVRNEKNAFRHAAAAAGIQYTERRAFDVLFNGLSIDVAPSDRMKVARLEGVKAMYPVEIIAVPEADRIGTGGVADLATAIQMTGANIAQSAGWTGAGVKVAVMDTGIDYDHPDLGGCFGPGCRVAMGYDFVGDAFNADPGSPSYNPIAVPDSDPDDCNGHGTHVAGIVGASGAINGVAPGVTFGAYRVFGCAGSTTADIMVAAMERALEDGNHVLNMSIGSAFQWPQYPTAQASDRLVNSGMVVVASIGNSGANGLYSAGAPGLGQKVIGVASYDNINVAALTFNANPGGQQVAYLPLATTTPAPTSGTSPEIVYVGRGCNADAYLASPAGKVALIVRGTCTFNEKYAKARANGAVGVIIHNNLAGIFAGGGVTDLGIFGIGISLADGMHLRGLTAPVTATWTSTTILAPNPTGNLISSFSSYGLSPDLALKPDIGAPGGLINSTYPLELGGSAIISGTSMASPHVAGGAALLLEAKPNTPSQAMRGILQNSADPKAWSGNPGLGFLDFVHRQGAGMVDIDDAILATTKIEPAKIAAGEGAAGPYTQTLKVENNAAAPVTYNLSFVNALSTGGVITPGAFLGNASVTFSAPSVTVPANASATFDATITPATGPTNGQYGGYVMLTDAADATKVFRVPFAGFVGDYQGIVVLTPTANGFPWLAKLIGSSFFNQPGGATYTMAGGDIPYFLVHLDHQARRVRFEAFDAVSGKAWQRVSDDEYAGRNSEPTTFFAFTWDGTTFQGKGKNGTQWTTVPDGQYVVKLSVLKALGDENDPAHWETWTSPVITIDRP